MREGVVLLPCRRGHRRPSPVVDHQNKEGEGQSEGAGCKEEKRGERDRRG